MKLQRGHWETILIIVIGIITFSKAFSNDFLYYDDAGYISDNLDIQAFSLNNIKRVFSNYYVGNYQPVTMFLYMVIFKLFGKKYVGFFIVQLILHLLNTVIALKVIRYFVQDNAQSLLIALLFMVSPYRVESVVWVSELKDTLYLFFFLLALKHYFEYLFNQKPVSHWLLLLYFVLGCLSKSMMITLPLIILSTEIIIRKDQVFKHMLPKALMWLFSIIVLVVAFKSQGEAISEFDNRANGVTLILLPLFNYGYYFISSLLPGIYFNYSILHFVPESNQLTAYLVLGIIGISSIVLLVGPFIRKKTNKKVLVVFLIYIIALLPVVKIIGFGREAFAERYTYFAAIPALILIVHFLSNKIKNKAYLTYSLTFICLVFVCLTYARTSVYKNNFTLFNDVQKKYPNRSFVYLQLGVTSQQHEDYLKALEFYKSCRELIENKRDRMNHEDTKNLYNNIGVCSALLGNKVDALKAFEQALQVDSKDVNAMVNTKKLKAEILLDEGNHIANADLDAAINKFKESAKINPEYKTAYENLCKVYYMKGQFVESKLYADTAIHLGVSFQQGFYEAVDSLSKIQVKNKVYK